ncbi:MAG: peptide ABC transporter substrate-binding protein [Chloroflexi bacterium]|nr:MAG: peptide ABC transporter substrate-binding protein [Chloroflexota bacterium]
MSFLKQRGYLLSLVALGAVLAFAACGSDNEKSGGTASPGGQAGERIQGGTLTGQSLGFQSLDPHFSNFAQDIGYERMLWRGLYTLDKENVPQPAMADGQPQVSEDGLTYTIKMKKDLKWSDGQPLTAKDFVAGFKRTCNPANAGNYESLIDKSVVGCGDFFGALGTKDAPKTATPAELQALQDKVGVKAIDDTTVEIKLMQKQVTFPLIISLWLAFPVPTHLPRFGSETADKQADWGTDPKGLVYNGPYMLTEYVQQDHITLVPNPNWAAPAGVSPTLDKLVIKFIEKNDVADNAFEAGELDQAFADLSNLAAIKSKFGAEYFKNVNAETRGLEMELTHKPLDNLDVRLALSQAIDRKTLNDVASNGGFAPTTSWIPETAGGAAADAFEADIGFNKASAQKHLADAGFSNGQGFPVLKMLIRDTPEARAQAEFLKKSFKEVLNIDTELDPVDSATRSQRLNDHQYELAPRSGWSQDYPDPENWIISLFDTGGSNNVYTCSDTDIDALIVKAHFNTNDQERRQQYKEINKLVVTRLCGVAPYYHGAFHWLIKPYVVGMQDNATVQDSEMPGDWNAEAWGRSK